MSFRRTGPSDLRQGARLVLIASLLLALGLSHASASDEALATVTVSARAAWTDTGADLEAGAPLRLRASGTAWVVGMRLRERLIGAPVDRRVGPGGTYVWPRDYPTRRRRANRRFPLPTMVDGPTPAFGLIGKIGSDGAPFYVGERFDGITSRSGRLWLGINDDDVADNSGSFQVTVTNTPQEPPPREARHARSVLDPRRSAGAPIPRARALLLYIDGLRPDVLHDMASAGFLPNLKRLFLDQGVEIPSAFTAFPSNTLIANGSLWTGCFSDRTGIKSQNQFERTTLKPKGQVSEWLPDGFIPQPTTRVLNLLDKYAPENTHAFLVQRGIPTLASRLGKAFRFTTLPIAPLNPPTRWFHCAVNTLGPFGISARLPLELDTVNAQYAIEELIGDADARVLAVWFPMADKTSHHSPHGQFGAARRDLVLADRSLGRILHRLHEVGWDRATYAILVSDHGHMGGGSSVNQRCNLPRDWAHRQLGFNARVVGQEWAYPGIAADRFVFFDNQGAGQTKIFLPYGSYFDGPWRPNRLYELTHYEARPRQVINLLESLTAFHPDGWDGRGPRPIDLILVKLDAERVLVYRDPDNQAVIHRAVDSAAGQQYRYEPVRQFAQQIDGAWRHEPPLAATDPFGYLQDAAFLRAAGAADWVTAPHSAQEWLQATQHARYPDAVVAIAKFFAWRGSMETLAQARDPDLLVTASEGWSFRSDDGEGTDHGYPLADSMRISLFLSGPNIAHGVLPSPQRIIDVLPTLLEMIRWPYDPHTLDGRAIQGLYE